MTIQYLSTLPSYGYAGTIYYVKDVGKTYAWDAVNSRFYNLSTPSFEDVVGINFNTLHDGDVLTYNSITGHWENRPPSSGGVTSFNTRTGAVTLLSSDVTSALTFTPENIANKQTDLTASSTKYPTVNAVNTGLSTKEPVITAGTTSQYWRGDKSFQTLDKTAVGLNNVDNTSDANKPVSTAQSTAIGLKEDTSNKSTSTTDSASSVKFPVWSAIVSYFSSTQIKSILGITTLSGSNTGDETNSTIITKIGYTPANKAGETFTGNISAPQISSSSLANNGTKVLVGDDTGKITNSTQTLINTYIDGASTNATILSTSSNWDANGLFIGTGINGTYQGQCFYTTGYFFTCVSDDVWIRLKRQ